MQEAPRESLGDDESDAGALMGDGKQCRQRRAMDGVWMGWNVERLDVCCCGREKLARGPAGQPAAVGAAH